MTTPNAIEQTESDHRLTIDKLRSFENLPEEIMFDLTNEEFENMMNQIDSSACIEPLYFPMPLTEQESQCVGYY